MASDEVANKQSQEPGVPGDPRRMGALEFEPPGCRHVFNGNEMLDVRGWGAVGLDIVVICTQCGASGEATVYVDDIRWYDEYTE